VTVPVARSWTSIASSEASPWTATTSAPSSTAMFDFARTCSTRYRDMLLPKASPRQRIVTLRAWFAKKSAACPAELPAPMMWTSKPCVLDASLRAAP
jgi:hypothetical protein